MNNKSFFAFLLMILIGLSFFIGYYFGAANTLDKLSQEETFFAENSNQIEQGINEETSHKGKISTAINNEKTGKTDKLAINASENESSAINEEDQEQSELEALIQTGDVMELLGHLLQVSQSENPDEMEQFGPTIDALQTAIESNPGNLPLLLDYFVDADSDSKAHYYITSVLQGVDSIETEQAISGLINRLTAIGTSQANEKLLHLVASTGAHHDNQEVIETVKNIALYGQDSEQSRLYALDLLMPFQLNQDEKNKVVSDFSIALNQAPSENKSYLVENIIRFTNKDARPQLANDFLEPNNDFATRVAILSTLHSGSVTPNQQLKDKLFTIAQNTNDPLQVHAKHALMYVFEIDNEEYQRLMPTNP